MTNHSPKISSLWSFRCANRRGVSRAAPIPLAVMQRYKAASPNRYYQHRHVHACSPLPNVFRKHECTKHPVRHSLHMSRISTRGKMKATTPNAEIRARLPQCQTTHSVNFMRPSDCTVRSKCQIIKIFKRNL